MTAEKKANKFRIACGFVIFFSILFAKVTTISGLSSIWDIIFRISDGSFGSQGLGEILIVLPFFLMLLINLFYLIRSLWLLRGKNLGYFNYLSGISLFLYSLILFFGQLYTLVNLIIVVVDYMGGRWIEERDAINAAYEAQKEREKAEKEEKKRIRYFPGKYPAEFFRIIRKNYVYGKRGQMILGAGCALTAAFLYIMLTMYGMIKAVHAEESFIGSHGLARIFLQTGLLVALFSLLLLTMIISYYIKDQKNSNRLMVILGMRSRTVYLMFSVVFGSNVVLAGIPGMACGMAVSYVLREILQSGFLHTTGSRQIVLASAVSLKSLGIGVLAYLLVVLLALALNQENVLGLAHSMDRNAEVQKERRVTRCIPLLLIAGLLLCLIELKLYTVRGWSESMYIHLFGVLGILLLMLGGIACYLKMLEKNRDRYHRKLFTRRALYYRYWRSTWNLFYMSVVHFFVLAVFGIQFTGTLPRQDVEQLFPYDIVCTAYDADIEAISNIAQEHGAKADVYPMLRMTSVYGSEKINTQWGGGRPVQWPQGQHIAISQSSYQKLKEAVGKKPEKLALKENEMHVVYQQDLSVKANTIDWDTTRIDKRLRIGQPLTNYNPNNIDRIFPIWTVRSEERDILTGTFHQGMQDNLIVFNDGYFQEQYDKIVAYNAAQWKLRESSSYEEWRFYTAMNPSNMTEGPTRLLCLQVPEKGYSQMLEDMQFLEEKHRFDRMWDDTIHQFYGKQQMMVNAGTEILFRKLTYLFIVILVAVMGFFQYYVKFQSEVREMNWQHLFLKRLGMREKERKQALAGQMKLFAVLPLSVGIAAGLAFSFLTVKARLYEGSEIRNYAIAGTIVYLFYIGMWTAWYFWLKRKIWRQAEWEN